MTAKVFLSYEAVDENLVRPIARSLIKKGIEVWFKGEPEIGVDLAEFIDQEIKASDYVLVFLSDGFSNYQDLIHTYPTLISNDWFSRGITVLPVVFENRKVPSSLTPDQYFTLASNSEEDIASLVYKLSLIKYLDFSEMHEKSLMPIINDLLIRMGFEDVKAEHRISKGNYISDFVAYTSLYTSEGKVRETWLVEVKAYRSGRASTQVIQQLANYISSSPVKSKGLLITNSQLTSAALSSLIKITTERQIDIRVIDGMYLKSLLLHNDDLIMKYFVKSGE